MFRSIAATLLGSTILVAPAQAETGPVDGTQLAALGEIVVVGQREGYRVTRTNTATKTDTPLKDVPQAVAVVTAEQMADQGMVSMTDVLRAVPGATVASGEGHRDQILIRGQNTTADFFVDGIRDDVQYYRGLYNLDRVEVLKGPNAMIFGRGGGGGIVNRVTKAPVHEQFARGAVSLDSHGAWSAMGDLNSPLSDRVEGRLNAAYERFESFRDHVDGRRLGVNPTLSLHLGENTLVGIGYEYANDRRVVDRGIPSQAGKPLSGHRDDFFGDPAVNRLRFDAHVADLHVDHRLSDTLRWTAKARLGTYDKHYRNALAATPVQADGTVGIEAYQSGTQRDSLFVQNDLVATLRTGGIEHTLLAGIDAGWQDSFSDRQQGYFDASPGAVNDGRRLFVPLGATDHLPAITFRTGATAATAADTDATAFGIYVQDQAKIGDYVELVAGLRHDWFRLHYDDRLSATELTRKDSLFSPRLGLVVKPDERLSLYASWSKSFLPQSGDQFSSLNATTASLAPEKFLNREVGVKWLPIDALEVQLAAYLLDRTNTRAIDPVTSQTVLTGEQRSKGVEASVTGRILPQLSVAASAALQEAEYRSTSVNAVAGRKVPSVPRFTSSLWGRYDLGDRLGLGLGIYHQSKMFAATSNAVTVPGFTRVDAAAFVGVADKVDLQLNVENLFDKDYIGLVHNDNNLTPGNPRTLRASLRFGL